MIAAAGILFVTPQKKVLLLQRAEGDAVGLWAFPGGKLEDGETAEDAAKRECQEEIGFLPDGPLEVWTRRQANGVDYTTFLQSVEEEFTPRLNSEHSAFVWMPVSDAWPVAGATI